MAARGALHHRRGPSGDRRAQVGIPFDGWTSEGRSELEVPGASSAERWDFRYAGPDGEPVEGTWVLMSDEETGRSAAVQLTGAPLDDQLVFDVVRSLRLDPDAPAVAGPTDV